MVRHVCGGAMASALAVGCLVAWWGSANALENLPVGLEAMRGKIWNGEECCGWKWDWVQESGPIFRGKFRNTNGQRLEERNIIISIRGDRVEITRGSGSAAGGCTYEGTIRVGNANGDYWCAGRYAGKWGAMISSPAY